MTHRTQALQAQRAGEPILHPGMGRTNLPFGYCWKPHTPRLTPEQRKRDAELLAKWRKRDES